MHTDRWRLTHLVREAHRNVLNPHSRPALLLFLAVIFGVGGIGYAAAESHALTDQLTAEQAAGRNIISFGALDPNQPVLIGRASCDHLTEIPGVTRAGLVRLDSSQAFLQLGTNVPVMAASQTLFPALGDGVVLVGSALRPAAATDFTLATADGTLLRAQVNDTEPTGLNSNSAVVVPLTPTATSSSTCIAVLDQRADASTLTPILTARLHITGGQVLAQAANTPATDPIKAYLARPGQYLPLILGLVGGLATGLVNRSRSSELAAYRMSGTSRRSSALLLGLETTLIAGVAATAALAAILTLQDRIQAPLATALSALAGAAAWWLTGLLTTIDIPFRNAISLAKDR
jgi:hypothetical protein